MGSVVAHATYYRERVPIHQLSQPVKILGDFCAANALLPFAFYPCTIVLLSNPDMDHHHRYDHSDGIHHSRH